MITAPAATAFATALGKAIKGEVDASSRRRAEYSSDASNYRVVPQVVAFPTSIDDVLVALAVATDAGVPVTMRGGGTSVAGNAIGTGLVLDTSRHMDSVISIDPEARTARVEPGAVLATLQRAAAPHGLRFGPDPSTLTRATLGGMIGNNACGPRAVAFGRTADNVLSLDVVDGLGRRFIASDDLTAVPGLAEWVAANLSMIRPLFGRFSRQVSGYSLEHLLPENGHNLARFLVGTEGTLATVLEAEVKLVPIPKATLMGVFGYDDMPSAADAVVSLLPHGPQAIEGLDARLVERVRGAKGAHGVPDLPPGAGWLFVEVGADTAAEAKRAMAALAADSRAVSQRIVEDRAEATALWDIRADGAGLAGRTEDNVEAWPGWEDAAVPPKNLGAYLRDFDVLMAKHGLHGQPFGHFGDGCVHVRLDIPLGTDGAALRSFMEEAATLVVRHEGSLSGEHGDGRARSELLAAMYGPDAIRAFGEVKGLFDPDNLLNPGIVVDPRPLDADLRRSAAPAVKRKAGWAFEHDHGDLSEAVHRCTGVGKCRGDQIEEGTGFMCPSYAATKDEKDVTRGRARVLQEAINGSLVGGLTAPEVIESLDLCLACKACSSDCPSGVDMAAYKAEVLNRRYRRKIRPIMHYSLGWLPRWLKLVAFAPRLINALLKPRWIERIVVRLAGLDTRRHMPRFAATPFRKSATAKSHRAPSAAKGPEATGLGAKGRLVVLWADSFTDGLDPAIPEALVAVLEDAGFDVAVSAGEACCGITWITTGQLEGARRRMEKLLGVLGPFAVNGVPIIGVEPSCMAALRSDLTELLPDDPRAHAVSGGVFTLAEMLTGRGPIKPRDGWKLPDLSDVTAVVQPHCHHHSVMSFGADRELLASTGATVIEASGCCGMAGMWGTTPDHYDLAAKVAETSLLPALADAPDGSIYLADGYSCRTQADDLAGVTGRHLAQLLAERSAGGGTSVGGPAK